MNTSFFYRFLFLSLLLCGWGNLSYAQHRNFSVRLSESTLFRPAKIPDTEKNNSPEIQVFLPENHTSTGRAVLICPGGGYGMVAWEHEGTKWAPFFNDQGIAVIVLKYRLPHGDFLLPLSDAEAALDLISKHAAEWKINTSDIGIMGFSAGGHLASTVATHKLKSAKLAFQILFYPVITMDKKWTHMGSHDNLLGKNASEELEVQFSNEKQVSADTPPAIIIFAADDHVVPVENGIAYFQALVSKERSAALHIYPTGGHGWGFNPNYINQKVILEELKAWLSQL